MNAPKDLLIARSISLHLQSCNLRIRHRGGQERIGLEECHCIRICSVSAKLGIGSLRKSERIKMFFIQLLKIKIRNGTKKYQT